MNPLKNDDIWNIAVVIENIILIYLINSKTDWKIKVELFKMYNHVKNVHATFSKVR